MAEIAVSFLLRQLSIWLLEEKKLLGGVGGEAQIIRGELEQTRAFLRAADSKEESESDPQLKEWVKQMREIAYDANDVLESYMLRFASRHSNGITGRLKEIYASVKNLKAKHQMASEIKAIRSRTENASKTFRDLSVGLQGSSSARPAGDAWYDGRGDALLLEEADVVGIEKRKKDLLAWLSSYDYSFRVVSMVGMAGLGKTTLVKKVYDDPSIKVYFDHHVWVTVSESFEFKNILSDVIKQLRQEVKEPAPPGLEAMNADALREFIYNFLQNKKYIIVLDDVWSTEVWEALKYSFPKKTTDGPGCVIITTRLNSIGDFACRESGNHVYPLEPLSSQEAEELFHRKAFPGSNNSCPNYLKEISKTILKRCEGLPLAIVLIGGLLATKKPEIEEWTRISLNLGSELVDNIKRMRKLLSLSYYDLPYYLKACFLYLSIFPEDHSFGKATIIRLWMAEGFVEAKQGKTMEEIAESYLYELINRSLVQVAESSDDGRPRNFRIHDLIREYIISKAAEQNMVAAKNRGEAIHGDRIRRLTLDDSSITYIEQISNIKYLRSLLFFGSTDPKWVPILNKVLRGGVRMLKTLDLRGSPLGTIPDEVFKLYHLECLCLRDTNVEMIPKSIRNLQRLQTLDLKGSKVTELPIEILKLQRLVYLLVYSYKSISTGPLLFNTESFKAPYEIGRLLNLQKLCHIDASATVEGLNIVKEIGKLRELRRLGISKLRREDGKELCSSLANLTNLRSLQIVSLDESEAMDLQYSMSAVSSLPFLRRLCLRGCLETVPQWIPSLNALTELRLKGSRLRKDPLECLQGLPNLLILALNCAYEGEMLSFNAGGFQKLKKLLLFGLKGLRWGRVEKGSMPSLLKLNMYYCKAMLRLPEGIEHLDNLKDAAFCDMAQEFVESVYKERTGEGKLAHVAGVFIGGLVDGKWEGKWS